jgi:hypothetical protein
VGALGLPQGYDNWKLASPPEGAYYCEACRKRDRSTQITEDEAECGLCADCLVRTCEMCGETQASEDALDERGLCAGCVAQCTCLYSNYEGGCSVHIAATNCPTHGRKERE